MGVESPDAVSGYLVIARGAKQKELREFRAAHEFVANVNCITVIKPFGLRHLFQLSYRRNTGTQKWPNTD